MDYLAQRLQQLRRQKGLSQENLAEQLGVSRQAVGKWESGAAVPELEKLLELCRLFDTDLNDLLGLTSRAEQSDPEQVPHQPQGFTEEQMNLLRQLIREGRQQAAPSPQPVQKRRKWPWLLVAAAVVIGGISLSEWYEQLQQRLWNLQAQAGNTQQQIGILQNAIGNIENNIKETLAQQASILTFSGAEICDVTLTPLEFRFQLWALPKNRTEQTRVRFSLETDGGTELLDAAWTGDRYAVEATMPWCAIKTITVVVEENGTLSSEVLENAYLNPAEEMLLDINGWASMHVWSNDQTLSVQGGVYIRQQNCGVSQPTSVTMWLERDGTQFASIPLRLQDSNATEFWDYDSEGLADFDLPKQDQTLTLHARVTDSLGCTYTVTVCKYVLRWQGTSFEHTAEIYDDNPAVTVTLPDGSTVTMDGLWKY